MSAKQNLTVEAEITNPMTIKEQAVSDARSGFVPCPACKQYSHSIGEDQLTAAFNHFHTMLAHPVRGHAMCDAFDEKTKDAAQVLMSAAMKAASHPLEQQQAVSGDVVERVARAISSAAYDAMRAQGFSGGWDHDEFSRAIASAALTASGMGRMREAQDRRNDLLRRLMSDVGGCFTYAEDAVREAIGNTNYSVIMQWVEEARTALQEDGRDDGAA